MWDSDRIPRYLRPSNSEDGDELFGHDGCCCESVLGESLIGSTCIQEDQSLFIRGKGFRMDVVLFICLLGTAQQE